MRSLKSESLRSKRIYCLPRATCEVHKRLWVFCTIAGRENGETAASLRSVTRVIRDRRQFHAKQHCLCCCVYLMYDDILWLCLASLKIYIYICLYLLFGDTWRLPFPPVIAAKVTRFCILIGDTPAFAVTMRQDWSWRIIASILETYKLRCFFFFFFFTVTQISTWPLTKEAQVVSNLKQRNDS